MQFMLIFFRAHPWQTVVMMIALVFAGIADGIGMSVLLPLLNVALRQEQAGDPETAGDPNRFEQAVVDTLARFDISPTIGVLLSIMVAAIAFKSVLLLVATRQVGYTAAQVTTNLRLSLLRAVLRSKWEFFLNQPVGKLSNSLATEAKRSSAGFVCGVTMITFVIQAIVYGGVAIAISWQATLVSLAVGTMIVLLSHSLVRMARRAGKKQTSLLKSLLIKLTDTMQSVKPLKSMAREHNVDAALTQDTNKLNTALQKQVFSVAVLSSAQELMFTAVIATGMYAALTMFHMPMTTVMVLVVALGRMMGQMGKVQKQYQKMVLLESAFWSMKEVIDEATAAEEEPGHGVSPPDLVQGISLRDVVFSYGKEPVLDGLSLDVPAGSLTTLVGRSGAGKTTIIDLVIGLLQPDAGEIRIDKESLNHLEVREWRSKIGYVPQETLLLHDSILHNVTLDDPALSEADVERALRQAGIFDFVSNLPDGVQTVVGERGGKLSGGQRQRVAIARALVHRPRLLILDEATSALDPASEVAIAETIEHLRGELTILAISHQDKLVEAADRVYQLQHGKAALVRDHR